MKTETAEPLCPVPSEPALADLEPIRTGVAAQAPCSCGHAHIYHREGGGHCERCGCSGFRKARS